MKPFFLSLVAVLALSTFATPAEARRGAVERQELLFVANTEVTSEGTTYALCQLVTNSYVLAANNLTA